MRYYRVKREYGDRMSSPRWSVIANELYTESEVKRRRIPMQFLKPVDVPKSKIYTLFGARFEVGTDWTTL